MFYKCIGIKTQEDFEKVVELAKAAGVEIEEGYPTQLFDLSEADYRLRELHTLSDFDGNEVEITEEMVREVAYEMGEDSEEYIDGESIDMIVSRWAKSKGMSIGF